MERIIPLVDLDLFKKGDAVQRNLFVDQLGKAFHQIGFVGVVNHGVPKELVDGFYTASKAFFSLPETEKLRYEIPGLAGQRGYTSFGKEHAKHSEVGDLKEFFQIGQTVLDGDAILSEYPENVKVEFPETFTELGFFFLKESKFLFQIAIPTLGRVPCNFSKFHSLYWRVLL